MWCIVAAVVLWCVCVWACDCRNSRWGLIFLGRGSLCVFVAKLSMLADIIYIWLAVLSICNRWYYTFDCAKHHAYWVARRLAHHTTHTYHIRHTFYTNQIDRINTLVSLFQFCYLVCALFFPYIFFSYVIFILFAFCCARLWLCALRWTLTYTDDDDDDDEIYTRRVCVCVCWCFGACVGTPEGRLVGRLPLISYRGQLCKRCCSALKTISI